MDTTSINWWPYPVWGATTLEEETDEEPTPALVLSLSSPAEPTLEPAESSTIPIESTGAQVSEETLIHITALSPSSSSPLSIKPSGVASAQSHNSIPPFKILLPILVTLSVILGSLSAWFLYGIFINRRRRRKAERGRVEREEDLLNGTRRYEDMTVSGEPFLTVRQPQTNGRSPDLEAASSNGHDEFGWPDVDVTTRIYTGARSHQGSQERDEDPSHQYQEVSLADTPKISRAARTKKSTRSTRTTATYQSRDTASLLSDDAEDDNAKYHTLSAKLLSRIPGTRKVSATGAAESDKSGARRRTSARTQRESMEDDAISTKTSEPHFKIIEDAPVHLEVNPTGPSIRKGWEEWLGDKAGHTSKPRNTRARPTTDRASSYYPSEYSYAPDGDNDDDRATLMPSQSQSPTTRKAQRHTSKKSSRSGRNVISRATTHYPDFNSDDDDDDHPAPTLLPTSPSQITSPLLASSLTFSASQVSLASQLESTTRMAVLPEAPEEEKVTEEKSRSTRKLHSPVAPPLPFPKGPGAHKVYKGRLVKKFP